MRQRPSSASLQAVREPLWRRARRRVCPDARQANLLDVTMVGPAAAAEHVEMTESVTQRPVLRTELGRIARVQILGLVELGVTALRGVGTDPAQALHPIRPDRQCGLEVGGMRS